MLFCLLIFAQILQRMENLGLDSNEFKVKNDGMYLIVEIPFSLDNLKGFIAQTCLAERCDFLERSEDVEEVCSTYLNF